VALEKFPITIKPGFSRRLPIGVRVNDHEDRDSLNESVKLFTSPSGSPIVLRVIVQVAKRSLKHEPLPPEPDELFSNAGNLIACFISFCRKEPGISSLVLRVLRLVEVVSIFVLIAGLVLAPPDSSVASDEYNYADEEAAAAGCVNGGGGNTVCQADGASCSVTTKGKQCDNLVTCTCKPSGRTACGCFN
jgi:hypothetical protein